MHVYVNRSIMKTNRCFSANIFICVIYICIRICANVYVYLFISLGVFVCVLVFVHLAQGLVQVEPPIIPSNDYY